MKYSFTDAAIFIAVFWFIARPLDAAGMIFVITQAWRLGIYGQ